MRQKIGQAINRHLEKHVSLYVFITVLFLMGIIFGTLIVQSLGYTQRADLFYYFQQFMGEIQKEDFVDHHYAFWQNYLHYIKYIGVIWILGLSIIGLPIILILLFLKGVFVGFTVGFLVHQMGWQGFFLSLLAVVPQNMIVVPLILFISVVSISFSFTLISHLFASGRSFHKPNIPRYTGMMAAAIVVLFFVVTFQTYFSPWVLRVFSVSFF